MDVDYRSECSSRANSVLGARESSCEDLGNCRRAVTPIQSGTRRCVSAPVTGIEVGEDDEAEPLIGKDRGPNGNGAVSYTTVDSGEVNMAMKSKSIGAGVKTFKRRYYILLVYIWMAFCYGLIWTTWGPIAHSAEQVLGFKAADIALLQNSGPVGFLLTFFLISWMVDKKGARWVMVICSTLIFFGTGIRCFIAVNRDLAIILIFIGQFMIGLAICINQVMAPVISAVWFPTEQRVTATALGALAGTVGMAVGGIVGPYVVSEQFSTNATTNASSHSMYYNLAKDIKNASEVVDPTEVQFREIVTLMIIQTCLVAVGYLCVLFYYPARPPVPPTRSQMESIKRSSFKDGATKIVKNPQYWLLCLSTSVLAGVGIGWLTMMDVNLKEVGVPQQQVGWLIFGNLMSGVVAGIIIGRIGDYLTGHHKTVTLVFLAIGTLSVLFFTLQITGIIPSYESTIFLCAIISGISLSGTRPMILEMVLELTYPVREGISLSILQLVMNTTLLIFYCIQLIPGIGTQWMNWAFIGVCFVSLPMLFAFKAKYHRLRVDSIITLPNGHQPQHSTEDEKIICMANGVK